MLEDGVRGATWQYQGARRRVYLYLVIAGSFFPPIY